MCVIGYAIAATLLCFIVDLTVAWNKAALLAAPVQLEQLGITLGWIYHVYCRIMASLGAAGVDQRLAGDLPLNNFNSAQPGTDATSQDESEQNISDAAKALMASVNVTVSGRKQLPQAVCHI